MTDIGDYGPPGEPGMGLGAAVYEWALVDGRPACPRHRSSRVEYVTDELRECSNGCHLIRPRQARE